MTSITYVTATCNRPSLLATYKSVTDQLGQDDRYVIVTDGVPVTHLPYMPKAFALQGPKSGNWGHSQREFAIRDADLPRTSHIAFIDDDDLLLPYAIRAIRRAADAQPECMILAKFQARKGVIWKTKDIYESNVGTAGVIVPWQPDRLGSWRSGRYAADYDFIIGTAQHLKVCFIDFCVQMTRQDFSEKVEPAQKVYA